MSDINIGKLIEDELRSQHKTVVWLADKLNCNRTNIYKIFQRQSIDTELLLRISKALNRNFFDIYIQLLQSYT
ncbi:MAG: XRE family transcriptional regulator [Paramuribaculum sp.]|nr:XRE family transcriptional regulator [Paramuribaculum sp.]